MGVPSKIHPWIHELTHSRVAPVTCALAGAEQLASCRARHKFVTDRGAGWLATIHCAHSLPASLTVSKRKKGFLDSVRGRERES